MEEVDDVDDDDVPLLVANVDTVRNGRADGRFRHRVWLFFRNRKYI